MLTLKWIDPRLQMKQILEVLLDSLCNIHLLILRNLFTLPLLPMTAVFAVKLIDLNIDFVD